MRVATRVPTSPRRPLRGPLRAVPGKARRFDVDCAARQGLCTSRAWPALRRDGETRVLRRYGRLRL